VGALLMRRIGPGASYVLDVLPPVVVFATGLVLTVAPLTATVLESAPDRYVGAASGVNNAIARAAGLLAVAVVPVAAGLTGTDYTEPAAFGAGFRTAMLITAALLVAGALVAWALIRRPLGARVQPEPAGEAERIPIERCAHCGVGGPPVHPRDSSAASR